MPMLFCIELFFTNSIKQFRYSKYEYFFIYDLVMTPNVKQYIFIAYFYIF